MPGLYTATIKLLPIKQDAKVAVQQLKPYTVTIEHVTSVDENKRWIVFNTDDGTYRGKQSYNNKYAVEYTLKLKIKHIEPK